MRKGDGFEEGYWSVKISESSANLWYSTMEGQMTNQQMLIDTLPYSEALCMTRDYSLLSPMAGAWWSGLEMRQWEGSKETKQRGEESARTRKDM